MTSERTNWRDGYNAVDWGTTNRRAWAIDSVGHVTATFEDDRGLLAVPPGGFEAAAGEIGAQLGERATILAGMVGSNRGWREASYVACPAGAADLAAGLLWVEPGRTAIVPGVSQWSTKSADVMRGEEVQALGAVAAGLAPADCLICHPGTHAKWVRMVAGRIESFRTMMTGELFALLARHSILADRLTGQAEPDAEFRAGVREALAGGELLAALFGIRARFLLGENERSSASYGSGLLIGTDVRAALASNADPGPIVLLGRQDLCALYAAALAEAGRDSVLVDPATAFLAGIRVIVESLS